MKIEITRDDILARILANPNSCWGCGEVPTCVLPEAEQLADLVYEVKAELIENEIICSMNFYQYVYEDRYVLTSSVTAESIKSWLKDGMRLEPSKGHDKATQTFYRVWTNAVAGGLAQKIIFRYRGRFYSTAAAYEKAKVDWYATHPAHKS